MYEKVINVHIIEGRYLVERQGLYENYRFIG